MVSAPKARKHLLLVEDDEAIREALTFLLEAEGYAVTSAVDGREALERLRGPGRTDLILLDLMMPGMDGWKFNEELRHDPALAGVPVVVFSAVELADQRASGLGAAGHLQKPVETKKLLETVRRHCG
jgi:CheY-like chemotaxis protein